MINPTWMRFDVDYRALEIAAIAIAATISAREATWAARPRRFGRLGKSPRRWTLAPGALSIAAEDRYVMLIARKVVIDEIYVPVGRRNTLHPETVRLLAEDILENGLKAPIRVRYDGKRYILVEGLHRMEAMKWLGDTEIDAYLVQAQKH
jgi:hypothetical protein